MVTESSSATSTRASVKNAALNVVSPLGEVTVEELSMAPRLDSLEGKTIGMVWNGSFKSNVTLPAIAEALLKKYPTAKVIPYTEMPHSFRAPAPGTTNSEREALAAALHDKGCDALISGNGG